MSLDRSACSVCHRLLRSPLSSISLLILLGLSCGRPKRAVSLDPEEFIATARIPDNLKLELAAKEPNIVDPVSMCFDADGKMYVVEMTDYPTGLREGTPPRGRVRLLEDVDHDGYYEKATTFAQGLQYATSVLPWRGGVLVVRPPDIVFYKDTDGDGKADVQEVLFTGFPVANTQHNVNSLTWGLDSWVYAANGGNNGSARSTKSNAPAISVQRMDFRFRPDTGEVRTSYETTGGFGIATDKWGHMFGTHNTRHIQHMIFRSEYISRNPELIVPTTLDQISDHGSSSKLYQISEPETRVNHPEQAGHFSGGCGLTFYGGDALPPEYNGTFFVTDVVVNVVHQDVVAPDGPSFKASRSRDGVEFLAGKDNWFRPVNLTVGPEGALYVLDMHRGVIEHPEWIPEPLRKNLNLRAGDDKGRIYRIVPRGGLKHVRPQLSGASVGELVSALERPNKWWRDTAQRLLVERQDKSAIPLLVRVIRESKFSLARLHALWTLEGLHALEPEIIVSALADPSPGVRENALRMAEAALDHSVALREGILSMTRDPDARVRFQLALTLGFMKENGVSDALLEVLRQDVEHQSSRYAVLSALTKGAGKALEILLSAADPFRSKVTNGRREFIRQLAALVGARRNKGELASLLSLVDNRRLEEGWRVAALDGLADGLGRGHSSFGADARMRISIERLISSESTPLVRAALRVASRMEIQNSVAQARAMARAQKRASDSSLPANERLDEIELLGLGSYEQVGETLLSLMDARQPSDLQVTAARMMAQLTGDQKGQPVLANWRNFSPSVKSLVLRMLLGKTAFHQLLISALEKRQLTFGELNLDLEQRRRLLRHSTEDIQKRAAALFGDQEFSTRKSIVDRYLPEVTRLRGDAARGEAQFRTLCAKCHALQGMGYAVGSDLAMAFSKGKEDLLTSILDPNAAIEPEYTNYMVSTSKGEIITGIIKSETPTSITLMRANGESDTILRSEVRQIRTDGLSLMPEGLEHGLKYKDLADLLAFLQNHEQFTAR